MLLALSILVACGVAALAASARPRMAGRLGAGGCVAGCLVGLGATLSTLGGSVSLRRAWSVPYGELSLAIDPLSAVFLLVIFGLCPLAAVYGAAGLSHGGTGRGTGASWLCYNLLAASMAMVVMARNGVLFLFCWEVMALVSFVLVSFDSGKASVREAGRVYLVATHGSAAFLLAMFALLARETGSMDFDRWAAAALPPAAAGALLLLGLVGFGTKAGLVPFHVWLPEAHPAAPSHVSAVMSGAMIKMGIYGLLRSLSFLGPPQVWWGGLLIGVGVASALIGVLHALVQQDIKRILAYSSVENAGLMTIGLGLGTLGAARGEPAVAALGFAGCLFHVINHAMFKGLLFLGAGAVAHQAGERQIDRLGGLLRSMPLTGAAFLTGAAAIAALPPFNGFASEFLLYLGSYRGVVQLPGALGLLPLLALVGLALAGGLALACFVRLSGVAWLGTPRCEPGAPARDPGPAMVVPMMALAALCLVFGAAPGLAGPALEPAVAALTGAPAATAGLRGMTGLPPAFPPVVPLLIVLIAALALIRKGLLRRRAVASTATWGCGYGLPTPRMQHTGSSLAEPIREMFAVLLPARRRVVPPEGLFPQRASFHSEIVRPFQERLYRPAFDAVSRWMSRLRWLHHGRVQLYVLYIVVTLTAMVAWFLSIAGAPR